MATTVPGFKLLFETFAALDDALVLAYLIEARRYVNARIWGDKTDFATYLYLAHLLTIGSSGGQSTIKNSEKVGDLAITFANNTNSISPDSTSYLEAFLRLRKTLLISPIVVT